MPAPAARLKLCRSTPPPLSFALSSLPRSRQCAMELGQHNRHVRAPAAAGRCGPAGACVPADRTHRCAAGLLVVRAHFVGPACATCDPLSARCMPCSAALPGITNPLSALLLPQVSLVMRRSCCDCWTHLPSPPSYWEVRREGQRGRGSSLVHSCKGLERPSRQLLACAYNELVPRLC